LASSDHLVRAALEHRLDIEVACISVVRFRLPGLQGVSPRLSPLRNLERDDDRRQRQQHQANDEHGLGAPLESHELRDALVRMASAY
jgi:hypothetical protein